MQRSYDEIERAVDDAGSTLQHLGGRVIVTCSGGAQITGEWIELSGSRNGLRRLTVFSETPAGTLTTRIDIQDVSAVGVERVNGYIMHEDDRVLPSRRDMTLAAILMEAWGQTTQVTYGMMLDALDEIDGTGAQHRTEAGMNKPLDIVSNAMMPEVDKVLLHLAARNLPKRITEMRMLAIAHDGDLEVEMGERLKELFAERGESVMAGSVGDLPDELRRDIGGRVRLALARLEAMRAYHPFIERGRWASLTARL